MLIDSHCHLDMLEDGPGVIERAVQAGVGAFINIGVDLASSRASVQLAESDPRIFATVGLHPHDAKDQSSELWQAFEQLAASPRCVGVGEAGLDYHYDNSPRDIQREVFAAHIDLAARTDRTLVIHTRDAWDDTWRILEDGAKVRTVFHCFTGGAAEAERALALGATLSFSGIVTFKNADDIRAAASLTPLERMIIETDSPFLAPVPHRGRKNEPAYLPATLSYLAELKGTTPEALADQVTANTRKIFELPS